VETDPDVFSFHHDLAKEAIKGGLLGRERRRLHEAALEALQASGSRDHVAITKHAAGAGRYDQMISEARVGAHESLQLGSTYQALQLAETGLLEADDDLDLRAIASRAAWLAGLLDEAVEHADRWLQLARANDDVSEEAAALSLRMRVAYDVGDLAGMDDLTHALIGTIDQLPGDEERARAMAFVAQSYMLRDLIEPTCEWADKAYSLAAANGYDSVSLAATVEKGSVLVIEPATADEGAALLRSAAAEAERTGDHVLAARALINLFWRARMSSKVEEARELLLRMRRHAEAGGFDSLASHTRVEASAMLAIVDGDLDAAVAVLDEGVREDPGRAMSRNRKWLAVLRAGLALEAGELEVAAEYSADAKPPTARSAVAVFGLDVHVAARRGDLAGTRSALVELLAAIEQEGAASPSQAHDITAAALAAGLPPDELRPLVEQIGIFPGHRLDADHPWRQLLDAQLAEAEGRHDVAATLYTSAANAGDQATGVLARHRGTAHVGAARCLIALGDTDEARLHVTTAAEQLARWRGWRVHELVSVQRRLGVGPEASGPEALTPREREVAGLVAEGLTNAAVAERLFISPRTAAVHVSNILAKLGMASRAEIAAFAVRDRLSGASSPRPDPH
jgi:DNA-binding CsgD family transcriptional regulator/tetratricopeptide (TPR) repeat protein